MYNNIPTLLISSVFALAFNTIAATANQVPSSDAKLIGASTAATATIPETTTSVWNLIASPFILVSIIGMLSSFVLWYARIVFGNLLFRSMFYQLNLQDTSIEFSWFCMWFSNHPYTKNGSTQVKPYQKSAKKTAYVRMNAEPKEEDLISSTNISEMISNLKVNFVPGYGIHVLYRNYQPLIISLSINSNTQNQFTNEEKTREDIVIWKPRQFWCDWLIRIMFPCRDGINNTNSVTDMLEKSGIAKEFLSYQPRTAPGKGVENAYSVFKDLLCDCFYVYTLMTREKTTIYTTTYQQWMVASLKDKRAQHTVILDKGIWEDLYNDVSKFVKGKQWYKDRGIPYRRGYLLYGEPGCGKTTTISSIAASFNMNICVFSLDANTTEQMLNNLFATVPPNSILVFEDIDSIFPKDNTKKKDEATDEDSVVSKSKSVVKNNTSSSFSSILNCLDGISSQESRIVFMTTNFKEKLPASLIRNGRIDRKIYLGNTTEYQFDKMAQNFYPDEYKKEKSEEMWNNLKKFSFGMAHLQGFFLRNDTFEAAVESSYKFETYMKEEIQNEQMNTSSCNDNISQ